MKEKYVACYLDDLNCAEYNYGELLFDYNEESRKFIMRSDSDYAYDASVVALDDCFVILKENEDGNLEQVNNKYNFMKEDLDLLSNDEVLNDYVERQTKHILDLVNEFKAVSDNHGNLEVKRKFKEILKLLEGEVNE